MHRFDVFYAKGVPSLLQSKMTLQWFREKYARVMSVEVEHVADVYWAMQGENWSPNGEGRELIASLDGVWHTSMTVGDIVFSHSNQAYYMCAPIGFEKIKVEA